MRTLLVQGPGVTGRWAEAFDALAEHHPVERHWYLGTLGVDPPHQRRGVGQRLLAAFLERADHDGTPAWLETDRETNIRFYERGGFAVVGTVSVFDTPVWLMRRP
jgi:GNAT superfamily N-acetyltransferase